MPCGASMCFMSVVLCFVCCVCMCESVCGVSEYVRVCMRCATSEMCAFDDHNPLPVVSALLSCPHWQRHAIAPSVVCFACSASSSVVEQICSLTDVFLSTNKIQLILIDI